MIPRIHDITIQEVPGVVGRILTVRYSDGTESTLQVQEDQTVLSKALIHIVNTKLGSIEKLLRRREG